MISLAAPAKINWALNLAGRRADGYHELDMLMQSVSLCDRLDLEPAEELALTCDDPAVPCDERNLILRAARALRAEAGTQRGARIRLTKRIPAMAGLGGGSSDCAAALVGLNRLWNLGISHRRLMEIGLTLGADVPFCLTGGLCRAKGLGEVLFPIDGAPERDVVIVMPPQGLSTPAVFRRADELSHPGRSDLDAAMAALVSGDDGLLARSAFNMLYPAVAALCPRVEEILARLKEAGASFCAMSGSGSACFGLMEGKTGALEALLPDCRLFLARTLKTGVLWLQ